MPERNSYGQFCPVSMAAEIVCTRWTALVLRELLCGSARFTDIRKGVPRMSPTLLSKRLKDLEQAGVVVSETGADGTSGYRLTEMGEELRPVIIGLGAWGQRWVESKLSLRNLDPSLLMWDMRRGLDPRLLPGGRHTVQFVYPEVSEANRNWWLVIDSGAIDLCLIDPGTDIDLLITSPLRSMTAVWMGLASIREEIARGSIRLDGDPALARVMRDRLGVSTFSGVNRRVA
jgi:DNA-binding HxlR family transcriptional regulator